MPHHGLRTPNLTLPAVRQAITAAVARGVPVMTACRAGGVSYKSVESWMYAVRHGTWYDGTQIDPDTMETIRSFIEDLDRARAVHEARMVEAVNEAATRLEKPDWKAAAWYLSYSYTRKTWFAHHELDPERTPRTASETHQAVGAMSDQDLIDLASSEWTELLPPPEEST